MSTFPTQQGNTSTGPITEEEHRGSRRGFLLTLLVALPLLAGACATSVSPTVPDDDPIGGGNGGNGGGAGSQFVGAYTLTSINGNPLSIPYAEDWLGQDTYGRQYVEDGKLIMYADKTYTLTLKKALTIGGGPRVYAPFTENGTWSYTSSGMSGTVLLGPSGGNGYTIEVTPYTVTDTRKLDPFRETSELLIYVRN